MSEVVAIGTALSLDYEQCCCHVPISKGLFFFGFCISLLRQKKSPLGQNTSIKLTPLSCAHPNRCALGFVVGYRAPLSCTVERLCRARILTCWRCSALPHCRDMETLCPEIFCRDVRILSRDINLPMLDNSVAT